MTTISRRRCSAIAGLLAAAALAGCAQTTPAPAVSARATAAPPAVRAFTACFGPPAPAWAGTPRASLPTTQLELDAVTPSGDRVFGPYQTTAGERGLASVDLASGVLTSLLVAPAGTAGVGSVVVAPPWLAWVRATGPGVAPPWAIEARNLDTGAQTTVATGTAGLLRPGALTLRGSDLAWAQHTSVDLTAPTSEVRVYDLAARKQTVLESGAVGPPVFAGPYLVWTHAGGATATLVAVDAGTLLPAALPKRLQAQTGIGELAGSPSYLVWDTDAHHGTAWRIDRDQLTTFTVDEAHRLQFLAVAGRFLLWYTGTPSGLVMDLDTGGGYEQRGLFAGSDAAIVWSAPLGAVAGPKSGAPGTTVVSLAAPTAPAIPGCHR